MAQDKRISELKDIDLDDIEVVILIIAKAPKTLASAATFLSRRGWPTTVMNNLTQAIEFATEKKPDFVLISMNHPNPALAKFSELLLNNYGTTCVVFNESVDNSSNTRLNKSKVGLKIHGWPSGPNIHRSLRKFLAVKLNIDLDEKGIAKGKAKKSNLIFQKGANGPGSRKGSTLIKGEVVEAETADPDSEVVHTGKYTMTTKNRRPLKEITAHNPLEKPGNVVFGEAVEAAKAMKKSLFGDNPELTDDFSGIEEEGSETAANGINTPRELYEVGPTSIIERAVQTGLQRICRPSNEIVTPIDMIEQVGVFPVDSPTVPGYLVLAWPNDEKRAKEAFFKLAQQVFHEVFTEMGIQASLEQGFFVTLPAVDFATWSVEKAAFSFSTAHGNEEIGVAFFSTDKPLPKPVRVEDKSMYSIGLENISTEQPVNFKIYLYMKKNKKYFLYLRNGRQLQPEQKSRLKDNNVTDLFMKSIDIENLRMFLAACYLTKNIKKSDGEAA